jgi:hypothetical protein
MTNKEFLLCELRCTHARLRLAMLDVESIATALKADIVTPEEAAGMLWATDAVDYLGLERAEAA